MKKLKENKKEKIEKDEKINKKEKKKQKSKFKKFLFFSILTIIIILIILGFISARKWQKMALAIITNTPSTILDLNENATYKLGNERKQRNLEITQMPKDLVNAYVSIEDQRFYKHFGIDIKRTGAAIINYVFQGSSSFGGSSITQQLAKNITNDNSSSINRKITEWLRAVALEAVLEKNEILEAYLNIIYIGPNIYGVNNGAEYYFSKNISDLSLEECAFLAGLNHSPNSYNPFNEKDNSEKIKKRTKTVLSKMLELGYITQEQYDESYQKVDSGLKFKQGTIEAKSDGIYNYHADALISDVIKDLSEEKNISINFATNYLNMGGLTIYSTQNTEIQQELQKEFENPKYIIKSKNDTSVTSQAAMVVIDHTNGYVLGCIGGLGKKDTHRGFNRVTQAVRQTGSASKPIAVLLPALDQKAITPITILDDTLTTFNDGTDTGYSPINYNNYLGKITVRRAVESSQNIPFVRIMEIITPASAISYLEKLGITTLTEVDNNINLSLGGLDKGISPLEMAGAYATISNDGTYIEPTFYTKIKDMNNKTILNKKQEKSQVFSKQVSYILKNLLTEPVTGNSGTAVYCKIPNIDVAAKTGTTNDNFDRWLCGFTNYYTAVTWYGFDLNESIEFNGQNPAGIIWSNVMKKIHTDLAPSSFEKPNGILEVEICQDTNKPATLECKNTYLEYFLKSTIPDYCDKHPGVEKEITEIKNSSNKKNIDKLIENKTSELINSFK